MQAGGGSGRRRGARLVPALVAAGRGRRRGRRRHHGGPVDPTGRPAELLGPARPGRDHPSRHHPEPDADARPRRSPSPSPATCTSRAGWRPGSQEDPATAFGEAARALARADLTMVNLETAITEGGTAEPKQFTFRAPATAFTALKAAGVDVATMANNHGADFGPAGLADTLAAIAASRVPDRRDRPGRRPRVRAALPHRSAATGSRCSAPARSATARWPPGPPDRRARASPPAYSDRLVAAVRDARKRAEIVVVYLHWGIEGQGCPSAEQRDRSPPGWPRPAPTRSSAPTRTCCSAAAGWTGPTSRYGLGNYLWWRDGAYSNDTGVLRLTFRGRRVVAAALDPARIDERGVPVPATGETAARIQRKWADLRGCTGLAADLAERPQRASRSARKRSASG